MFPGRRSPVTGNRLAWIQTSSDRNIWRVEVPGTAGQHPAPTRLIASTATDLNPQYSPDGERIVFGSNRSGTGEIWVSDRDGRNPMRLTNIGGPVTGDPRWSPDGRQIAFDSMEGSNRDIYVVSSNGGQHHKLTTDPAEDTCPSWSLGRAVDLFRLGPELAACKSGRCRRRAGRPYR